MKTHLSALAAALVLCGSAASALADQYQFHQRVSGLVKAAPPAPAVYTSCLDLKTKKPESASGVYQITVGGNAFDVRCDMTSDGGGWTLVTAQFENDPVMNWNEGIQADYDPSLASRTGFALGSAQLPAHTHTGFGKGTEATFLDFAPFTYATGNIPVTRVQSAKTGLVYDIHRNANMYYAGHHPGASSADTFVWNNTLTFNRVGPLYSKTWAFSPQQSTSSYRTYAMGGDLSSSSETFAWTVWVR